MTESPVTPLPPPEERRRLREAGSLTRAQVASRVGVSKATVRAWESGRTTPHGRKAEAYATLLASLATEAAATAVRTEEQPASGPEPSPESSPGSPPDSSPVSLPESSPERESALEPLTPAQAFDALYAFCAPDLVRQAYVLTGRRELARESVERAFQLAWQRWPEVAVDPDPAGWVRLAAYEYALSPWHRFRPRYRHPEPPPADQRDHALLSALLKLPPPYRRTLLLYDGVGLDLPETAAETEATTPATANRLVHAREAVTACLPELADPSVLHRRLVEVASAERLRAARPTIVRAESERRARLWTRVAIAVTIALVGATTLTLGTAPTHYEPAVPPGEAVQGVPPRSAPGTLSNAEKTLRTKLRSEMLHGPERLVPEAR